MPESERLGKIADPALRVFAESDSTETQGVLVELALPERQVQTREVTRGGMSIRLPVDVTDPTGAEELEEQVRQAGAFLQSVIGKEPTWLASARTFVVRARPDQLRAIAQSPLIRAIWPNRSRSAGPVAR